MTGSPSRMAACGILVCLLLGSLLGVVPAAGDTGDHVEGQRALGSSLDVQPVILPLSHYNDGDEEEETESSGPPTAGINATRNGSVDDQFVFDARRSVDEDRISGYLWHFGDGSTANGSQVQHTYRRPGNYTVRLLLFDADGNTDTATVTVTVTESAADSSTPTPVPEQTRSVACDPGTQPGAVACERAELTATPTDEGVTYAFENVTVREIRFSNRSPERVTVWELDGLPPDVDQPRTQSIVAPVSITAPAGAWNGSARVEMAIGARTHLTVDSDTAAISRWTGERWRRLPTSVGYRGTDLVLTAGVPANGTYAVTVVDATETPAAETPQTAASEVTTKRSNRLVLDRSRISTGGILVLTGLMTVFAGALGGLVLTVRSGD